MTIMTKQELLNKAKEVYYNTGEEIMSDLEYDQLEEEIGLKNKNYIGTRHNEQYTVKHPMVMGSLSKVQIKKDNSNDINWTNYANEIISYLNYYNNDNENNYNFGAIITPKYDGCSFEIHMKTYIDQYTFSTRGDGEYGKDIKHIFLNNDINYLLSDLQTETLNAIRQYDGIKGQITDIVFRGEVLVNKNLFAEKYKDYFVNPRAFVAGTINAKFDDEQFALLEQIHDLSFVIYDVRYRNKVNNKLTDYKEFDWQYVWSRFNELKSIENSITNINTCSAISNRYNHILNLFPDLNSKEVCVASMIYIKNNIEKIYNNYETVRKLSNYALDGFVIKPVQLYRHNNNTEARPKDCVAIKFLPMITKTTVIDIEWSTGKTNELTPTVIIEPIELDGKTINRVSGHNFGYIYNNNITKGTILEISLAGDIIPFIYKVYNNNNINIYKVLYENNQLDLIFAQMSIRNITTSVSSDMIHLYKVETEIETKERNFVQRTVAIGIKSLGNKNAEKLAKWALNIDNKEIGTIDDFFNDDKVIAHVIRKYPTHLFELFNNDIEECFGGKTAQTIIKDIERAKRDMTLPQIIQSCCFKNCGPRASEICACIMVDGIYDITGIEYNAIAWAFDENSEKYQFVLNIIRLCNKTLNDYKEQNYISLNDSKNKTFVILTGEPNNYESKSDFLAKHPEYEVTSSWKKVQKVFTNDLNSNTGKMKKAFDYINKGYNISIELY